MNPTLPQIRLGRTALSVTPIGFGGYRIHPNEPEHRQALLEALRSGCNLIDTSANYTAGGSETLIGQVLAELFGAGELKREDVVVVTKAGYVPNSNAHDISPKFIEAQLTQSLKRLQLTQVDVFLLHNPEKTLRANPDLTEYYRNIKLAFEHLETEVARGRIRYYGISSNTFPAPRESNDFTSLDMVTELAEQISPNHHFAVIQFPFNLLEPGAALEKNNNGMTLLEYASHKDIGTLVNRPLNAYSEKTNRMTRLADFPAHEGENVAESFRSALGKAVGLEGHYKAKDVVPIQRVAWGHILNSNIEKIRDIDSWRQILEYEIRPTLDEALHELSHYDEHKPWAEQYALVSRELFDRFTAYFEWREAQNSRQLAGALLEKAPELASSPTLSQKAVRVYRSVPGVNCVLVGMRKPRYVREMLKLEPEISADSALQAIKAML